MSIPAVPWSTRLAFTGTALVCKLYAELYARNVILRDSKILRRAVFDRIPGRPLITISNHTSVLDDPLIWAACFSSADLMNMCITSQSKTKRWTLGAEEICFTNPLYRLLMHAGRVIPIRRGEGIRQPAVDIALDKLSKGDWVHVFVEGKIGDMLGRLRSPIRWGVGRLLMECTPPPIIVPFVHLGLERVVGMGRRVPKRASIDIRVGPIIDGGMLQQGLHPGPSDLMRKVVTDYLEERLSELYILNNPSIEWFKHEQVNT